VVRKAVRRIGERVTVRVEVPRGSFVKRRSDGTIDFVSPLPSPFNYGSVPGTISPDGEPLDAILLGPALPLGHLADQVVVAVVRFVDAGLHDPKLVCSASPLARLEHEGLVRFFRSYALFKTALNGVRGRRGRTAFDGFDEGR
jgi:inorganic pyrophosphatase